MELLMKILSDIWIHVDSNINWIIVLLVISSGYAIRSFKRFNKTSQTKRVIVISLLVTILYSLFMKIDPGTFIASYFFAFGFHTVLIKWLDRKMLNMKKSIGGGGHQPPPPKE